MNYSKNGKRAFDVILATALLITLCPLFMFIICCIWLTSSGPIFFLQERIGMNGQFFTFIKFRSMYSPSTISIDSLAQELSNKGQLLKYKSDPRVTPFGRWLRRTSLDELPQLFNVIRGNMSLVGPRPLISFMVNHSDLRSQTRHSVLPGITGYWQIYARHLNTSIELMYPYDLQYVTELSLAVDLKILCLTIPAVIRKRGAY